MERQEAATDTLVRKFLNIPVLLAILLLALLLATAGNYGIFGDELYYIACSKHLDFGYVDHPPLIALLTLLSQAMFGNSLLGLRLFPALAGAATVLLAAALARELGGGKYAQGLASLTVLVCVALLAFFSFMSMNAFDVLFLTLCSLILIKILNGASVKLWLLFGLVAGIGLQNKLTMLVFGFAAILGLLLTRQRRFLASKWPYWGGLIAGLVFLPYLIWQATHGWPTLEFIRVVQQYRNIFHTPISFFTQLILALNPLIFPVWAVGLLSFFFGKDSAKYRSLGILSITFLVIYMLSRSQIYYVVPLMPMLFASGAVSVERMTTRIKWKWPNPAIALLLLLSGIMLAPLAVPILHVESFITYSNAIGLLENIRMYDRVSLPIHFGFRFGWKELTESVAQVYNSLPAAEKAECAILTNTYSKASAINYFGPELGLPTAISGHNNYWIWGPLDYTGEVVICIGFDEHFLGQIFRSVELATVFNHPYVMAWETNQPIHVCRRPVAPLSELWPMLRGY